MNRKETTALATLVALLFITSSVAAQQQRYRLVDLGTLGGPGSSFNIPRAYAQVLNNGGTAVGSADTAAPDPIPGFSLDGFAAHAFKWRKGVLSDLGTLPGDTSSAANWVSANGLVAGMSHGSKTDPLIPGFPRFRAVLWSEGGIIDLGSLTGGRESSANAVNSRGQVVGATVSSVPDNFSMLGTGFELRAFLWQDGQMQDLGTLGGPDAVAVGINDSGQIIGQSYTSSTPSQYCGETLELPLATGAFLWQNGQMKDLGNFGGTCTFASYINNRGQVVGLSTLAGDQAQHAFLWENGVLEDLGTFGGDTSSAIKINEAGQAVGFATYPGNESAHAFLWSKGELIDLGTLDDDPVSAAADINAEGQVIGVTVDSDDQLHPFLWERGGPMVDLNSFLASGSGLQLEFPLTINNRGEIAVTGRTQTGEQRAVMLIPCGENETNGCQEATSGNVARATHGLKSSAKTGRHSAAELMRLVRPRSIFGSFTGRKGKSQDMNTATSPVTAQEPQSSSASSTTCEFTGTYGAKICSPTAGSTVTSPIHVVADASSNYNQMSVAIDGGNPYYTGAPHADVYLSATVGPHTVHVCALIIASVSRGICGSVSVTVVAASSCSAPASAGVHVCAPINGSTVTSPVHALARGLVTGTFARMELWVDGVKKLNSSNTRLDTYLTLGAGSHRFNFRAVNTAGTIWSKVVYATVK